jgi:hypothetical protein
MVGLILAHAFGFENKREEIMYIERSFDDYVNLLNVFVDDAAERDVCLKEAREITKKIKSRSWYCF